MINKKVLILGSCITRDAFEYTTKTPELKFEIINYFARTSIISLVTPAIPITNTEIQLTSAFQRRLIINDFQKTFFHFLKNINNKDTILIIDFIDERFDLLQHENSIITRSIEFINAQIESKYNFKKIPRFIDSTQTLWQKSWIKFTETLLNHFTPENIILQKARWSESYMENGTKISFSDQDQIIRNNNILDSYYTFFVNNVPNCKQIKIQNTCIADKNHKWGVSPFHYQEEYYINFLHQLKQFCENKVKLSTE